MRAHSRASRQRTEHAGLLQSVSVLASEAEPARHESFASASTAPQPWAAAGATGHRPPGHVRAAGRARRLRHRAHGATILQVKRKRAPPRPAPWALVAWDTTIVQARLTRDATMEPHYPHLTLAISLWQTRGASAAKPDGNLIDDQCESVLEVLGEEPHDEVSGTLQQHILGTVAAIALWLAKMVPAVDLHGEARSLRDQIDLRGPVANRYPDVECEMARSEERRVGKECRSRWSPYH